MIAIKLLKIYLLTLVSIIILIDYKNKKRKLT